MFAPMRPNPIMASSIRRLLVERLARIWLPYIVSHTAFVQRVHGRAEQPRIGIENHMHGNPCQQRGQTPFALEPHHELRYGQQRQDPAGDASPEIDAAW